MFKISILGLSIMVGFFKVKKYKVFIIYNTLIYHFYFFLIVAFLGCDNITLVLALQIDTNKYLTLDNIGCIVIDIPIYTNNYLDNMNR